MTHTPAISDIDQAKYKLVHDHPGGAAALAPLVRMNAGTLCNKVNPMMDTHHLTVDEAIQIQMIRRDYSLFYAEGRLFDHVTVACPEFDNVADIDLLNAWAAWHADIGQTAGLLQTVLEGAEITRSHLDALKREMFEDFQRALELLQRVEALRDD